MDKFIVSARKYRPQAFDTVVGQSHITTTLLNAIRQKQLAHAFLFCGPRGVGKTTCARILAKTINCENRTPEGEACDQCTPCRSFNEGASLNYFELDAASNNSVEQIRELTDQIRYLPQAGSYKVYVIDEVHMLSQSAFNAFLKTLEEPPPYAIFILATTEKHKILPTILSRCQIFDFKRITLRDTIEHLASICKKESIVADENALQLIAQKSEGCMRDALSILDKIVSFTNANLTYSNTLEHLNLLDEDYFFKLLDLLDSEDLPGVLTIYDEIDKKGFDGDIVLNNLSEFFRNLLVSRDPRSIDLLQVVEGFRNRYIAAAASISPAYMIGALNILNEAELGFKQARNKKLHVEFHLIKLTHLKQAVTLVEDGTAIKKKRVDEIKPVAFRQIAFAPQKTKPSAKLVIENPLPTVQAKQPQAVSTAPTENPLDRPLPNASPSQAPAEAVSGGLGSLKKIREQIQNRKQEQAEVFTLNEERLGTAWAAYLQKLQENNQVSSLSNLKMAKVTIIDELVFEIAADTRIQQQFIESEKVGLLIHVQDFFNNPKVQFLVQLNPSADLEEVIKDQPLSLREQYFKMIERYPIIKEMRDQLNLDLDY